MKENTSPYSLPYNYYVICLLYIHVKKIKIKFNLNIKYLSVFNSFKIPGKIFCWYTSTIKEEKKILLHKN